MSRMAFNYATQPTYKLKVRQFAGIDQSRDENDMATDGVVYTKDGYGFAVDDDRLVRTAQVATALTDNLANVTDLYLYKWYDGSRYYAYADHKVYIRASSFSTVSVGESWTDVTGSNTLSGNRMKCISYQKATTQYCLV